jgi:hypothetical protein
MALLIAAAALAAANPAGNGSRLPHAQPACCCSTLASTQPPAGAGGGWQDLRRPRRLTWRQVVGEERKQLLLGAKVGAVPAGQSLQPCQTAAVHASARKPCSQGPSTSISTATQPSISAGQQHVGGGCTVLAVPAYRSPAPRPPPPQPHPPTRPSFPRRATTPPAATLDAHHLRIMESSSSRFSASTATSPAQKARAASPSPKSRLSGV